MGAFPCPKCGNLRKIGSIIRPDGSEWVGPCPSCGDPEYWIPDESSDD